MTRPGWRHVARVTIELTSPLSLRSGGSGDVLDTLVVLDANGLPAIPGSSLAGALRAAWIGHGEEAAADGLFGNTDVEVSSPGGDRVKVGVRSRLHVSWGSIHGSDDIPVAPRLAPGVAGRDAVLAAALLPVVRDRVRLDHRGAVDGDGKFDLSAVAAGHRFTFELLVEGDEAARAELDRLVALLASGGIRLGAATRAGFGAFEVRRVVARSFDLGAVEDLDGFLSLDPALSTAPKALAVVKDPGGARELSGARTTMRLKASEPLIVGGGDPRAAEGRDSLPDIAPLVEQKITWSDGRGAPADVWDVVIPGTAIKGALRHRAAFHLRCLRGEWAHLPETQARMDTAGVRKHDIDAWAPDRIEDLAVLFGTALPGPEGEERGVPGCVHVSEVRVPLAQTGRRLADHIAIDRFTGGVVKGVLFLEDAVILHEPIEVTIRVEEPLDGVLSDQARQALLCAIDDLAEGRLNLGGGFGRGRGWFRGEIEPWAGPDASNWGART